MLYWTVSIYLDFQTTKCCLGLWLMRMTAESNHWKPVWSVITQGGAICEFILMIPLKTAAYTTRVMSYWYKCLWLIRSLQWLLIVVDQVCLFSSQEDYPSVSPTMYHTATIWLWVYQHWVCHVRIRRDWYFLADMYTPIEISTFITDF